MAGRGTQLALRAGLAVRDHRAGLSRLSGAHRRVALAPVPLAGCPSRLADAAVLPATPEGASAAGQTQRVAEAGLHLVRGMGGPDHGQGIPNLQAGAARLAHRAVRRQLADPQLALPLPLALR